MKFAVRWRLSVSWMNKIITRVASRVQGQLHVHNSTTVKGRWLMILLQPFIYHYKPSISHQWNSYSSDFKQNVVLCLILKASEA